MSAPGIDLANIEAEALALLRYLAGRYGVAWIREIVAIATGDATVGAGLEPVAAWVAGVVDDILRELDAGRVRAELEAMFAAANEVGDFAERTKYGPGNG